MPNMKTIIFLALILFSAQVICDSIDCTTLVKQADCQTNSNNCVWVGDFTKNTCSQSIDCSKNTDQQTCEVNTKVCQWKGYDQGCRNNADLCKINTSDYSCKTGIGCVQGTSSSCQAVLINTWGCEKRTYENCNTPDKPFCAQSQLCSSNLKKCPATVKTPTADQDCSGPCQLANITCQSSCIGLNVENDCVKIQGCQWSNNACSSTKSCPTNPQTVAQCTAVETCQVNQNQITCQGPANDDYQSYCSKLGTQCSDANYCSLKNVCVNDVNFCNKDGSCAKNADSPAPYKQCLLVTSKTCSFPSDKLKCASFNNQQDCQNNINNNLCLWSNGKTCQNLVINSECQKNYRNQTSCNTLQEGGCSFQSGGTCASKNADYLSSKILTFFTSNILYFAAFLTAFI